MRKAKILAILILSVLVVFSGVMLTFSAGKDTEFINSDCFADYENAYYYVGENGYVYDINHEIFISKSINQVAPYREKLYYSEGNKVHCVNLKNGNNSVVFTADKNITSFSLYDGDIYALVNGKILRKSLTFFYETQIETDKKVSSFWIEQAGTISYMFLEEDFIYTLDLSSKSIEEEVNFKSYFRGSVPVVTSEPKGGSLVSPNSMGITSLQQKFPHGKYWNHGTAPNNPDGYTSNPCTHHGSGCNYSGSCGCNSFSSAIQCHGYALKCGYDATGSNPNNWPKKYNLDTLKAGDVIRYNNYSGGQHTLFVIGVSGNTVTVTDCNWSNNCNIRWNATFSKTTLSSRLVYLMVAPYEIGDSSVVYTVYFDPTGGQVSPTQKSVTHGKPVGELPVPAERTGYNFIGWYTSATGGTKITESTVVNSNTTYYARWEEQTFTISFDKNGSLSGTLPETITKRYSQPAVVTTRYKNFSLKGYTAIGYNTRPDGSGDSYAFDCTITKNENMTLYVHWNPNEYKLTFNAGSGATVSPYFKYVYYERAVGELPVPEKTGYDFLGWFTSSTGGVQVTSGYVYTELRDISVYARWQEKTYTVTYSANGGDNAPAAQTKYYFSNLTLSSQTPTRAGHIFKGWCASSSADRVDYNPGQNYTENSNLNLYAVWEREKYEVKFDSNGAYGTVPSQIKEYGIDLTLTTAVPTKTGYSLSNWNTQPSGTGTKYYPGGIYSNNSPITLYAIMAPNKYTLSFVLQNGSGNTDSVTCTYDSTYPALPQPTRVGYTFNGWRTSEGTEIKEGDRVTILSNQTLYDHWTANVYTVTLDQNGGTCESTSVPVTFHSSFGTLPTPTKVGCYFAGWFMENGYQVRPDSIMTQPNDITLKAKYVEKPIVVSFDTGDESIAVRKNKPYGTLPTPAKRGHSFNGWKLENTGTRVTPQTIVSTDQNHLLEADFSANVYRVTFNELGTTANVTYGENFGTLPNYTKNGKVFCGWYTANGEKITEVSNYTHNSNITLYPKFVDTPGENYTAVFVANGVIVDTVTYDSTFQITEPQVPQIAGFDGVWEDYTLKQEPIVIQAIYMAKTYTITFNYGDITDTKNIKFGDCITVPDFEEIEGITFCGWDREIPSKMPNENLVINAILTGEQYVATFIANGDFVYGSVYDENSQDIIVPRVTALSGYSGSWEEYTLQNGGISVLAQYTPEVYQARFYCDNVLTGSVAYTVETYDFKEPSVVFKNGFTGEWEEYTLQVGGTRIDAIYNPNTYTVSFYAGSTLVARVSYLYGAQSIAEPEIPRKVGYSAKWGDYQLSYTNSTVYAQYTPIVYKATFIANGEIVGIVDFTVEDNRLNEPPVPLKNGELGTWETYTIEARDITIHAKYTEINLVIVNYVPKVTLDYRTTVYFKASVENTVPGTSIYWYVDGVKRIKGPDFAMGEAKHSFDLQAKYVKNGVVIAETPIERVEIKTDFFAKVLAWFRAIFKLLPVYKQY